MVKPETTIWQLIAIIEECISDIEEYTENINLESFLNSKLIKKASRKDLEDIGDACKEILDRIDGEILDIKDFEIEEFRSAYRFRAKSTHGYDTISYKVVFRTLEKSIPVLKNTLVDIKERNS